MISEKNLKTLAILATVASLGMYFSYIQQIQQNLAGHKVAWLQPLAAAVNCTLWTAYGFLKPKKDWAIVAANIPGIVLGLTTVITAL